MFETPIRYDPHQGDEDVDSAGNDRCDIGDGNSDRVEDDRKPSFEIGAETLRKMRIGSVGRSNKTLKIGRILGVASVQNIYDISVLGNADRTHSTRVNGVQKNQLP